MTPSKYRSVCPAFCTLAATGAQAPVWPRYTGGLKALKGLINAGNFKGASGTQQYIRCAALVIAGGFWHIMQGCEVPGL